MAILFTLSLPSYVVPLGVIILKKMCFVCPLRLGFIYCQKKNSWFFVVFSFSTHLLRGEILLKVGKLFWGQGKKGKRKKYRLICYSAFMEEAHCSFQNVMVKCPSDVLCMGVFLAVPPCYCRDA